jgi:hypothetical protein
MGDTFDFAFSSLYKGKHDLEGFSASLPKALGMRYSGPLAMKLKNPFLCLSILTIASKSVTHAVRTCRVSPHQGKDACTSEAFSL